MRKVTGNEVFALTFAAANAWAWLESDCGNGVALFVSCCWTLSTMLATFMYLSQRRQTPQVSRK